MKLERMQSSDAKSRSSSRQQQRGGPGCRSQWRANRTDGGSVCLIPTVNEQEGRARAIDWEHTK